MEQVPAADLLHVYSGLESDEVTNGILVDSTLHVVEEPSMLVGGVDITGADNVFLALNHSGTQHEQCDLILRYLCALKIPFFATVCVSTACV